MLNKEQKSLAQIIWQVQHHHFLGWGAPLPPNFFQPFKMCMKVHFQPSGAKCGSHVVFFLSLTFCRLVAHAASQGCRPVLLLCSVFKAMWCLCVMTEMLLFNLCAGKHLAYFNINTGSWNHEENGQKLTAEQNPSSNTAWQTDEVPNSWSKKSSTRQSLWGVETVTEETKEQGGWHTRKEIKWEGNRKDKVETEKLVLKPLPKLYFAISERFNRHVIWFN